MGLPSAATLAGQIVTDLGISPSSHAYTPTLTQWTAICSRLLAAIAAGTVTVNLADGTGVAPGVSTGSSNVGLSGTVTGTIA